MSNSQGSISDVCSSYHFSFVQNALQKPVSPPTLLHALSYFLNCVFHLGDRVFEERLTICSCLADIFSLEGSSGGVSGYSVRFDGIVISKSGPIIHL